MCVCVCVCVCACMQHEGKQSEHREDMGEVCAILLYIMYTYMYHNIHIINIHRAIPRIVLILVTSSWLIPSFLGLVTFPVPSLCGVNTAAYKFIANLPGVVAFISALSTASFDTSFTMTLLCGFLGFPNHIMPSVQYVKQRK